MLYDIVSWLGQTSIAVWIQTSSWAFPTIESIHVIAITTVVGVIAIMDLRVLGIAATWRPIRDVSRDTLPWVWAAFALAVLSGAALFASNAEVYFNNTAFLWKMALIAGAGLNMLYFELVLWRGVDQWAIVGAPVAARVSAGLSLAFWVGVVIFGRMIGFTLDFFSGTDLSQYLTIQGN